MSSISEVLIVGGGVIGLSIARELHRKGVRRITILDRGHLGREASYAAAGMLAPNVENDEQDDFYDLCSESCAMFPDFAAEILVETSIDIELERSGTLYLSFSEEDSHELNARYLWQRAVGVAVEKLSAAETLRAEKHVSPAVSESLFYPDDWQVENRKLLEALNQYAKNNGISVLENTDVASLIVENERVVGARSRSGAHFAETIVLATGAWTSLIKIGEVPVPVKVKPIRGQLIGFHPPEKMFQKVIFSPRGYIVPRADGRILAGATVEDVGFDRSTTVDGADRLRMTATEIAPCLTDLKIMDHWAGLRPYAADGLPVLGEIPGYSNLFIAAGHYRNGILLAPITAKLISERLTGYSASKYLRAFGSDRLRSKVFDAKG